INSGLRCASSMSASSISSMNSCAESVPAATFSSTVSTDPSASQSCRAVRITFAAMSVSRTTSNTSRNLERIFHPHPLLRLNRHSVKRVHQSGPESENAEMDHTAVFPLSLTILQRWPSTKCGCCRLLPGLIASTRLLVGRAATHSSAELQNRIPVGTLGLGPEGKDHFPPCLFGRDAAWR